MLWSRPPRAWALSGWALLPLRAFLGFTFCFAGLQKLANPNFFNANSPSSIQAQLIASERFSPLHPLLGHLLQFATPIGVLIAFGELAVGVGTLLGLWTRVAALGGLVLSLTLFLTVSFHATPFYTGADIVFFFAWIPLIVAGAGGVLSLDALIEARSRHEEGLGVPTFVPVRFSVIQQVCGNYHDDRCTARRNAPCDIGPCPFLAEGRTSALDRREVDDVDRRTLVLGGTAAAGVGVVALLGGGLAAGLGRAVGGAPSPGGGQATLGGSSSSGGATPTTGGSTATTGGSTPTTGGSTPTTGGSTATTAPSTAKPAGTVIGPAKDVPSGGAASFTIPQNGDPGVVVELSAGHFAAYDAVCPHAGCTVGYSPAAKLLVCPCHGSEFNPGTGAVLTGPAARGLTALKIAEGPDGQLYLQA